MLNLEMHCVLSSETQACESVQMYGLCEQLRSQPTVHARIHPGVLLGCNDYGIYRVEFLCSRKIAESVYVTFDETYFPGLNKTESSTNEESADEYDGAWKEQKDDTDVIFWRFIRMKTQTGALIDIEGNPIDLAILQRVICKSTLCWRRNTSCFNYLWW